MSELPTGKLSYDELKKKSPYLTNNNISRGEFFVLVIIATFQAKYGGAYNDEVLRHGTKNDRYSQSHIYDVLGKLKDRGIVKSQATRNWIATGDYSNIRSVLGYLQPESDENDEDSETEDAPPVSFFDIWDVIRTFFLT